MSNRSMPHLWFSLIFALAAFGQLSAAPASSAPMQGVLLEPDQATSRNLAKYIRDGCNAAILLLDDRNSVEDNQKAAARIKASGLELHYWIDVGRNQLLADAQPELMASLPANGGWRRHFPKFSSASSEAKNYPWVPLGRKEAYDLHFERVDVMLEDLPFARGIFLNHLQGAPSACGCGNTACRSFAHPEGSSAGLEPDAAARFVVAVSKLMAGAEVIPVWTTECAGNDPACGGENCEHCWKDYAQQLGFLTDRVKRLGVLLPLHDKEGAADRSAWQETALKSYSTTLPARDGKAVEPGSLIAVVQGWDASEKLVEEQKQRARVAGAAGYIVARAKLDQRWGPKGEGK